MVQHQDKKKGNTMEELKQLEKKVMGLLELFEKEEVGNKLSQFAMAALKSLTQQEFTVAKDKALMAEQQGQDAKKPRPTPMPK